MRLRLLLAADAWSPRREFVVSRLPAVLGRAADADVRVDDHWASRHHCQIDQRDGQLIVCDLGSRNGTLLNGAYVRQAQLADGDRLSVGLTTLHVCLAQAAGENPPDEHLPQVAVA